MNYSGKTIVVSGGAGAIGSNLVKKLAREKCRITVIDNLDSGHAENLKGLKNVRLVKGSITDDRAMKKTFPKKIDVVFHLAALFANQNSVEHPIDDLETNSLGTLKMLQFAKRAQCKRFIYSSSSCVYGNQNGVLREDKIAARFDTPYAISKLTGEHYVNFFNHYYGMNTVILRYFNAYGPGERPGRYRNAIPNFMKLAMQGKPLTITGTGKETRDFTFVEDTIMGTYLAGSRDSGIGQTINIGAGRETKIIDLAKKINKITKNRAGIVFKEKRKWDNISKRVADISRARRLLGYRPKYSIDKGLKITYKWFVKNKIK